MEKYLKRLLDEMAKLSHDALTKPVEKTEFEYGRVSGLYQGLDQAKNILLEIEAGNEERERES